MTARPASTPATNALRAGGTNFAMTGTGALLSAWICRNFDVSLEESIGYVSLGSALLGGAFALAGSIARNLLYEQEGLPREQQSGPVMRTVLKAIGGTLG